MNNTQLNEKEANYSWETGYLRLFLSHIAEQKEACVLLKDELHDYGISAFVAHEDIKPNAEWRNEILNALKSMHAMAALLTPGFHESNWTDQEIGFALGRGILIIPVRLGLNPYGFVGILQGLKGNLKYPSKLADQLIDVLLKQKSTTSRMRRSLVVGFEKSCSFATSIKLSRKIIGISDFSKKQFKRLEAACTDNRQVEKAFGVPDRIISFVREQMLP